MDNTKILIIEDNVELHSIIRFALHDSTSEIIIAADGREGWQQFFQQQPDLVLLDVMLPHLSGWELCQRIREISDVPIIMLTSLQKNEDVLRGLNAGADDFITKPFNIDILRARVTAVLRRTQTKIPEESSTTDRDNYLAINLSSRQITVNGERIKLTRTEYKLLAYLVQNRGCILTFNQILGHVWGEAYQNSSDYVHVYISHLRHKLEKDPKTPQYLLTEHGIGYRFEKNTPL